MVTTSIKFYKNNKFVPLQSTSQTARVNAGSFCLNARFFRRERAIAITSNVGTKKLSKSSHRRGNMDAILPLGDVTNGGDSAMPARQKPEKKPKKTSWTKTHALVLMEACRFKFEIPEGWLPEHWGIETSVISRRRNALLPVWESEGKKHHCMRLFTKDDFERIKPTLVKRFGEEGKGLITLENIRVRWNQICTEEGVNQVPNSKPTHKANAEAARNIAAYEASLAEYKRISDERAKSAAEFLTRANKVMKAGQKKLDDAINKSLGEAAVTSAATALFTTIGKLQDEAATLNHREKDPRKRDSTFALLIEELESHKDELAKVYIDTEWAKEYNLACGRSKLVVTETESQSLDDGNLVVANNGAPKKRKKADEPYGSKRSLYMGTVRLEKGRNAYFFELLYYVFFVRWTLSRIQI